MIMSDMSERALIGDAIGSAKGCREGKAVEVDGLASWLCVFQVTQGLVTKKTRQSCVLIMMDLSAFEIGLLADSVCMNGKNRRMGWN